MCLKESVEEQRHKLRDAEVETVEADVPKVPVKVYAPSPEEYNRHSATHLLHMNWCPICAQAKKNETQHTSIMPAMKRMNSCQSLQMDYLYMNETTGSRQLR